MKLTHALLLPCALSLALVADAAAQIKNGHFEFGGSGIAPPLWVEVGGVVQDPPEGAGGGGPGVNSAVFTTGSGVSLPGHLGAAIGQRFKCGPLNPQMFCWVRLDYLYDQQPPQSNSKAFVYLQNPLGSFVALLPDNTPGGPDRVQFVTPGCGPMKIVIGVLEQGANPGYFASTLLVDHVVAKCDEEQWPNAEGIAMTPYAPVPGTPVGDLIQLVFDEMGSFQDLGGGKAHPGTGLVPHLEATGTLAAGENVEMAIEKLDPAGVAILVIGLTEDGPLPGLIGLDTTLALPPGIMEVTIPTVMPAGVPPGIDLYLQVAQLVPWPPNNELTYSNKVWGVTE